MTIGTEKHLCREKGKSLQRCFCVSFVTFWLKSGRFLDIIYSTMGEDYYTMKGIRLKDYEIFKA